MSIRLLDPSGTTPAEHKCMKPVPALEEFIVLQKIIHPQTHPLNTAPFQSCPSLAFSTITSVVLLNSASLRIWPVVSTKVQAFLGDSVLQVSSTARGWHSGGSERHSQLLPGSAVAPLLPLSPRG